MKPTRLEATLLAGALIAGAIALTAAWAPDLAAEREHIRAHGHFAPMAGGAWVCGGCGR